MARTKQREETLRWTPEEGAFGGRKSRTSFNYRAFVPDEIRELDPTLPADVAAVAIEAEVAVRTLNSDAPQLGALDALSRQLLRAEAVASSRIEGLRMSHRRVARAGFAPELADEGARTVLGNIRAMEAAIELGAKRTPLRPTDLLALHRILFADTETAALGGRLRVGPGWLGGRDFAPVGATYIPPRFERIPKLMEDMCAFAGRDDLPAIAQAAIVHAQFETIHPFPDGNGRIGRCLIHIILRRRGVAPNFVPPISLILATDQAAYVRGLVAFRDYTPAAIASWIGTFAAATRTSATEAGRFAGEIRGLQADWRSRSKVQRAGSLKERIIEDLPARPIVDAAGVAERMQVSGTAARNAIDELRTAGVLSPVGNQLRYRIYEALELFDSIDRFERDLATPTGRAGPARPAPAPSIRVPPRTILRRGRAAARR